MLDLPRVWKGTKSGEHKVVSKEVETRRVVVSVTWWRPQLVYSKDCLSFWKSRAILRSQVWRLFSPVAVHRKQIICKKKKTLKEKHIGKVMFASDGTFERRVAHQKPCGAKRSSLEELHKCFVGEGPAIPPQRCAATMSLALTLNGTHLSVWIVHFRLLRSKHKITCRNASASPPPQFWWLNSLCSAVEWDINWMWW